jgi:hypothetical protein
MDDDLEGGGREFFGVLLRYWNMENREQLVLVNDVLAGIRTAHLQEILPRDSPRI